MTNLEKLRVHIAPVGFEIDRIVLSAKKMKADKIWLLVHSNRYEDKASWYLKQIEVQLKKNKIVVEHSDSNRDDVFDILRSVKEIFEKEQENQIYVNVSSGSKIQAIACMMACMIFKEYDATPYYVEPERYHAASNVQQSEGLKRLLDLPAYEIHRPKNELVRALKIIHDNGSRITKKQMAELVEQDNLITVHAREENKSQARLASLAANIIDPLEKHWGFIETEKIGRNHWIKITEKGSNAARFLT
jgi:hypothetical protein